MGLAAKCCRDLFPLPPSPLFAETGISLFVGFAHTEQGFALHPAGAM